MYLERPDLLKKAHLSDQLDAANQEETQLIIKANDLLNSGEPVPDRLAQRLGEVNFIQSTLKGLIQRNTSSKS